MKEQDDPWKEIASLVRDLALYKVIVARTKALNLKVSPDTPEQKQDIQNKWNRLRELTDPADHAKLKVLVRQHAWDEFKVRIR
jgi:hypothetical protein